MTWIAACIGQRGIYQEVVMTDEERQELCATLRRMPGMLRHDCIRAADEIERLAARVNALEHIINLDMYEVTKTALVQAQDEIERLAALVQSDAEPVAWPDIDAAVKAGLATRNPAPDAAAGGPTPFKTVTISGAAPPHPDTSAGQARND